MKKVSFGNALLPILGLVFIMILGLVISPNFNEGAQYSLEAMFIIATVISCVHLMIMGYKWSVIQESILKKLGQLMPAALILLSIGVLIGSWVLSGTIPMLIHFGVDLISVEFIYLTGFLVCAIFSLSTGTSWGSAGTIGVVLMSIGGAIDANLPMLAGAIVAGAYFGDKMSPLSDTTNIAALASDVPLMKHIRSMMNTTIPAALVAITLYIILGFTTGSDASTSVSAIAELKMGLETLFNIKGFATVIMLLIPVGVVVYGSLKQLPTVPVMISSAVCAMFIAMFVQGYSFIDALNVLVNGFDITTMTDTSLVTSQTALESITTIVNRGGLYSMVSPVIISMMVFIYVGTLDTINAIPVVVDKIFSKIRRKSTTIISTLIATMCTNGLTSNQFATSFIIAETFKPKYEEMKIPKQVLSRSLEDAGTMVENILPWSTTGIYMAATLGVSPVDYAQYQFVFWFGIMFAVILAITGKGCFYNEIEKEEQK